MASNGRSSALLLATAAAGCLLYTDPINRPPTVSISGPTQIFREQSVVFRAEVHDPDEPPEGLDLSWFLVESACASAATSWPSEPTAVGPTLTFRPRSRSTFCVRARVRDRLGAEAESVPLERTPTNQAPTAALARDSEAKVTGQDLRADPTRVPLWSMVRVTGAASTDPDSDRLTYVFAGRAPDGADLALTVCPDRPAAEPERCFVAEKPGAHTVTLTVSDGITTSAPATLVVSAAQDTPPCIDPDGVLPDPVSTPLVIIGADDGTPRSFEIKRVIDDGHPLPPGPRGRASFVWFVEQGRGWEPLTGYDRPEREIGAGLFDDVRPGKTFGVRVVVQDPLRREPRAVWALEEACKESDLCEEPKGCLRWVTWKLRVQ